jgi:hypothetical protein
MNVAIRQLYNILHYIIKRSFYNYMYSISFKVIRG